MDSRKFSLALLILFAASPLAAETWTDLNGTQSIEARMIGIWDDHVILDMNGKRVSVHIDSLRSDSRIQAREIHQRIEESRKARLQELDGQANALSAPAPNPIPKPSSAPPYEKPLPNTKVADFLQSLDDQVMSGHLVAIYDALPPSYRKDVNDVAKGFAAKLDPNAFTAATNVIHQVGDLLVTRQNWVFSNPRMQNLSETELDDMRAIVLSIAGIVREGFRPDSMQLTQLQTMNFGQWLADRDRDLSPYVAQLMRYQDVSSMKAFEVVSESPKKAKVKITMGQASGAVDFVNIEGYWVPESLASTWNKNIAEMKADLAAANPAEINAGLQQLAASAALLAPFTNAKDEQTFHDSMESMLGMVQPVAVGLIAQSGMSRSSNGPSPTQTAYNADMEMEYSPGDFGDEEMMDEDYDEEMMDEDFEQ